MTEQLAEILERPVDDRTRARACLHLVDWLACAALGATAPAGAALIAYTHRAPVGACFTVGGMRRAPEAAAFVNGGLGNIFEMDDLHRTSIVHPGDVVIPAALALAEDMGANGPAVLDAIVRGYEAAIRIGVAAGTSHYEHWYNTATCGGFGAAATTASLLGLDRAATVDALGQAGMQAAGLWQCRLEPTYSKQLATARAAQSGVVAGGLAALGFPGAREILEGAHGFFVATCPGADPGVTVADPGGHWRLHDTSFKPWSACRHAHPVIEAGLVLHHRTAGRTIREIMVATYRDAVAFCDNPTPATPHEARFSLQHCAALALLEGRAGLADFTPVAIAGESITALRRKISVRAEATATASFPERYSATVAVAYEDGSHDEVHVENAKGDPENPMTKAEITAKSHELMAAAGVAGEVVDALWRTTAELAHGGDISALSTVLDRVNIGVSASSAREKKSEP